MLLLNIMQGKTGKGSGMLTIRYLHGYGDNRGGSVNEAMNIGLHDHMPEIEVLPVFLRFIL